MSEKDLNVDKKDSNHSENVTQIVVKPNDHSQTDTEQKTEAHGTSFKHVVVIRDPEDDSGISESASEESSLMTETSPRGGGDKEKKEGLASVILQIFFPYLVAGFGMMLAGILLDYVQHWEVFIKVSELYILVPALLGLKGNLEMTLASRLSTAANLGEIGSWKSTWQLSWGNLSLIQGQALMVAFIATMAAIVLGFHSPSLKEVLLLGGASMTAACLASALLGSVMIVIVLVSRPLNINPDNVATPIAASLGDLVTLALLAFIAHGLYQIKDETTLISGILCLVLFILIPLWLYLAYYNETTRSALYAGWIPVLSAVAISSVGGLVLKETVHRFPGIAIYSPIINGMGGNLVAVQASRISTSLHSIGSPGAKPPNESYLWQGLCGTFWKSRHARIAALLLAMVIPGAMVFLVIIKYVNAGHTTLSPMFLVAYLTLALLQVFILLVVADWMVHFVFWRLGFDPDNIAIPFLTALGDLLGTGLLSLGFVVLWYLGDRDQDVGE